MLTTTALFLVLSCSKPAHPISDEMVFTPPPVTSTCEGPDRVERNLDGFEVRRSPDACTIARCEGGDFVRRTLEGVTTQRIVFSPSCMTVRCEGGDQVRRDSNGRELDRTFSAMRCLPRPTPRPVPQNDVLRFGLSVR